MVFRRNILLSIFILLVIASAIAQPEISVKGGGFEISDGQNTWPDSTGQAFGVLTANQDSVDHTFWILNEGTADLNVTDINVRSTTYDDHFSIVGSTTLTISAGDSTAFTIRYSPTGAGTHGRRDASPWRNWIDITSDDADESTFDFSISGAAIQEDGFDCSSGRMLFSHRDGGGTTDLKEWNYEYQPPTLNIINNGWTAGHDGMGLNPNDNRIYAMRYNGGNREQLWTFDQSGNSRYVADVIGGGITAGMGAHASAGAFDNNNNLYTFHNADATTSLNKINVRSAEAELITLSDPVHIRGAIYNPDDGLLYGFSAGATHDGLVSVNPNDGTVNYIGGDGDLSYAAMFRSSDGAVYMMSQTYSMYLVDLTDGSIEQIGTNPGWGDGNWVDGCACGEIPAEADVNITLDDNRPSYTPGSIQTYTLTVKNSGPWGSYRDTVRNALPVGVTLMSWTSTTSGTAVSDNPSGSGALEDVVDISVGDSIVYTVKIVVPPGFTGNLINTASVTASTVVADPDMSNNSASDTDVIFSSASEVCNNGFDDDGDGEVDCFDGDCAGSSVCGTHYTSGVIPECPDTPDVALFSMREQYSRANVVSAGYATPIVGDLDGDGIPEIVVNTTNAISGGSFVGSNATIRILDGQTGAIKHALTGPRIHYFSHSTAIADVDKDGDGEIYIVNADQRVRAYDHTLTAIPGFTTTFIGQGGDDAWELQKAAGVQFADFDQDGQTEIFIGIQVLNALTGEIVAEPPTKANVNNWSKGQHQNGDYMPAAADVLPDDFCPTCSGLEIIAGNTVYAIDLSNPIANAALTEEATISSHSDFGDGFTSIADWDGDDSLDVIVTTYRNGASRLYIWNPRTQALVTQDQLGNPMPVSSTVVVSGRECGRASVADFDGDGINELAIVSRNTLKLYDSDLSLLWDRPDIDDPSSLTSATAFDFEGDGNVEVIYRDNSYLRILDGVTGVTKDSLACSSGTRIEMPVIADVDADGQAEIAIACGDDLVVFEADLTPWMPTRKVWNTLSYSPVWVNDDLTIPAHRQNKATVPRNDIYAAQAPITDPLGALVYPALPDFVVTFDSSTIASCDNDSTLVHVTICNEDANALLYNYPISYYDGDPNSGGTLIGTRTISIADVTVQSTNCYSYSFNAPNQPIDLYIIANDDGTGTFGYPTTFFEECDSTNNVTNGEIGCPFDAGITKDDGELHYIPGGARTYEIIAKNNGPSFTDGIVSDPLPIGISAGDVTWTATTYGGTSTTAIGTMNGALQDTVDIPAGDSIIYSVTISTPDNLAGDLVNVVSINVVGDTITDNNTATDIDTVDCTFAIAATVNSRTAGWTQIGTVVGGFTYNFSTSGGTKTFTPGSGPEAGESITTVVYNTGSGNSVSLRRHRYNSSNTYFGTISSYDNTPHAWTGLSGTAPENAPILGFMAFVDRNGNGTYDSGTDDFIRDINTLSITPDNSGELYIAFYDDGVYTDNNGLINIESSIDPITVDLGVDRSICPGESWFLDAGYPEAVSWVWNTGATTQGVNVGAGEYSVIVTTSGGCTATDTVNIDNYSLPNGLPDDTTICYNSTITVTADTGSAWLWNTGAITQSISVTDSDTVSVRITTLDGCIVNDTMVISEQFLDPVLFPATSVFCEGDSFTFHASNFGSDFLWSTGDTNQTLTVYDDAFVNVTITDSLGCSTIESGIALAEDAPNINIVSDTTLCPDSSIVLTSLEGDSWTWSTGETTQSITVDTAGQYIVEVVDATFGCTAYDTANISFASVSAIVPTNDTTICSGDSITLNAGNAASWLWGPGGETTQTIRVTDPGSYDVQITYSGGCGFNDTIEIGNHILPTVNLGPDTSICDLENITFNAGSADSWTWSTGENTQTITVSTADEYDVEIIDANGCRARDTIELTIDSIPLLELGNDTTICPDSSLTLTSIGGSNWTWNTAETTQSITVNTNGTYSVSISDGNNCVNNDDIVINIASAEDINLGNDTSICSGETLLLDAGSADAWIWSTTETSQTITVSSSDTYIVDVNYTSGCTFSDTIEVTIDTLPIVFLGNDTSTCDGTPITIDAGAGASWSWNTGETTATISVSSAGTYSVNLIDGNGCEGTDEIEIRINALPSINLGNDTVICIGESVVLSAGIADDYLWSDGSSASVLNVTSTGTYWVDITDANNCVNRSSIDISVNDLPVVDLGGDQGICEGESLTLDAGDFVTEVWNSTTTSPTYTVSSTTTVNVVATDVMGCEGTDEIEVTMNASPTIEVAQADSAICDLLGEETNIWVVNPEGMALLWSTGETIENIIVADTGYFTVSKTNEFSCSVNDTVFVDQYCEEREFTMPNVFSPDGDGSNETFIPMQNPNELLEYFTLINFRVINRWGVMVHVSKDYLPFWDGIHQGTGFPCPAGAYFWIIDYTDITGKEKSINGFVQLISN